MFRFDKEQSVWDFNGTMIGGQPGEYPTVLGASIFYNKHEVVLDDEKGTIDKVKAEALWNRCQVLSDETHRRYGGQYPGRPSRTENLRRPEHDWHIPNSP